ncbi:fructose-bisphosphatase class II, partial [Devosia sp.]|uniref:fructose-bisphosphatase class II n=1 Tax=Devosia sp. TaxID=1871048 RepID=UPI002FCCAEFA
MRLSKVEGAKSPAHLHRSLTLELVRVTERAAIAAAEWRGKGNEQAADEAAVLAMKAELDRVAISGRIVIGEGEENECDNLYIGQAVGAGQGPEVDIAVDPLEGTT